MFEKIRVKDGKDEKNEYWFKHPVNLKAMGGVII
jgi:hypothetical protein